MYARSPNIVRFMYGKACLWGVESPLGQLLGQDRLFGAKCNTSSDFDCLFFSGMPCYGGLEAALKMNGV